MSKSTPAPLYRHGDVLIQRAQVLPPASSERSGTILARGELTGHSHRIAEKGAAKLWQSGPDLYLEVLPGGATVVHEEHADIPLEAGIYKVWMQREYSPEAIRRVVD